MSGRGNGEAGQRPRAQDWKDPATVQSWIANRAERAIFGGLRQQPGRRAMPEPGDRAGTWPTAGSAAFETHKPSRTSSCSCTGLAMSLLVSFVDDKPCVRNFNKAVLSGALLECFQKHEEKSFKLDIGDIAGREK